MKKLILLILSMTFFCTTLSAQKNKELPIEIKTYITTYFSSYAIKSVEKGKATKTINYILDDSTTLKFNSKRIIVEIESKEKLPDVVIPASILKYVTQNYPEMYITNWKLVGLNQQVLLVQNIITIREVISIEESKKTDLEQPNEEEQVVNEELINDVRLEFDADGKFVKIVEPSVSI